MSLADWRPPAQQRWAGVNVSAWPGVAPADIAAEVTQSGANIVTVPVLVAASDATDSQPAVDGASLSRAQQICAELPASVEVHAEPYPWIAGGTVAETLWSPVDVAQWFTSWQAAVLAVADALPAASGIIAASNLAALETPGNDAAWCSLLRAVKAHVGQRDVIYRTNWWLTAVWDTPSQQAWDAKRNLTLFSEPDVVAISAYFELGDVRLYDDICAALHSTTLYSRAQNVVAEIEALHAQHGKPIAFGELGVPSRQAALTAPWNNEVSPTYDADVQANAFAAYWDTFAGFDWWRGYSRFSIGVPFMSAYDPTPALLQWEAGLTAIRHPAGDMCQAGAVGVDVSAFNAAVPYDLPSGYDGGQILAGMSAG